MSEQPGSPPTMQRGGSGAAVLGGVLIVLGLLFFAGQQLDFDIGRYGWPLYVIAPGLALATFGLTQAHGSGLTVAGSIVTIVGVILLWQNWFDYYESWAYAWALVGPGGSGVGMLLYGVRSGNDRMARDGFRQILVALGLFAAGLLFFEGIIGIGGDRFPLPEWVLPVAVIILGVAVLVRGFMFGRRDTNGPEDWESSREG